MPTYDYKCSRCRHALAVEQRITDKPKRKCPECGRLSLDRQITGGTGFILVGQNWEKKNGY